MIYDTIIIGKGPCGISCAVYLKRFNLNPLIIAKDGGALEKASTIDNYYGFSSIKGTDLIELGITQAKNLDIPIIDDEVISVEVLDHIYIKTKTKTYEAYTLFLAMGKSRNTLKVKNVSLYEGKGISYCAICDGFFFKNKNIGIVGAGPFMENEYEVLKNFSKNITIFTNEEETKVEGKIVKDKIISVSGSERLETVTTQNKTYQIDGLFVAIGHQSGMSLALHLGIELKDGNIVVDSKMKTNIPHIYAGGDVIGGILQISKAVSDGALASLSIKEDLKTILK